VRASQIKIYSKQRGAALLMAMLFLVIITLIGVTSMVGTALEERMARNSRETNIAFQAAEAALRDAETDLNNTGAVPRVPAITTADFTMAAGTCSNTGECKPGTAACPGGPPQVWDASCTAGLPSQLEDTTKSVRYGTYTNSPFFPISAQNTEGLAGTVTLPSMGVSKQPRYVVEYLGGVTPNETYRITAIGYGPTPTTKVILQEEVAR